MQPAPHQAVTYATYLKVDELLALQQPRSDGPEHDEMLFIIIHQVYELWFKQMLHEASQLQAALESGDRWVALAALNRMRTILKTLVSQVDILETMTPVAFGSFRARLDAASGFQSVQFRELEVALGRRPAHLIERLPAGAARDGLMARMGRPSVYDSFLRFLAGHGQAVPRALLERDYSVALEPNPEIQALLVHIYHNDKAMMSVCERLVDLDEGLQEWRYRHVKMVERTIGGKMGTGGSSGVEYLKSTLFKPHFPDLWAIRSEL